MSEEIIEYKGYKIKIEQDTDCRNPYRDWDQLSDVTFWLRNYALDSTGKGQMNFNGPDEVRAAFERGEIVFYAPVWAYIHSGITVKMGERNYPYNDQWDSGLAGVVYVTWEKAKENWPQYNGRTLWHACRRVAKCEIETLDQYLTGDVWGYVITNKGTDTYESCWGFYGQEYCLAEAKSQVDALVSQAERKDLEVREEMFAFSRGCL